MTSRLSIHGQIDDRSGVGNSALGTVRVHCDHRPVRVSVMCRGQDFMRPRSTGGSRHKLPSFFPVSIPPSALPRCGGRRQAVERIPPLRSGLPLTFKTTDHVLQDISDWSPATAHQCASFAATNVAREAINDVEEVCK